jgi:hypothetical protein
MQASGRHQRRKNSDVHLCERGPVVEPQAFLCQAAAVAAAVLTYFKSSQINASPYLHHAYIAYR